MPMRLWSTVTSQLATRPRCHCGTAAASALAATAEPPPHVGSERAALVVRPAAPDRRHRRPSGPAEAVAQHARERRLVLQRPRLGDGGPHEPLAAEAVAGGAGARPLLRAERLRRARALLVGEAAGEPRL